MLVVVRMTVSDFLSHKNVSSQCFSKNVDIFKEVSKDCHRHGH